MRYYHRANGAMVISFDPKLMLTELQMHFSIFFLTVTNLIMAAVTWDSKVPLDVSFRRWLNIERTT